MSPEPAIEAEPAAAVRRPPACTTLTGPPAEGPFAERWSRLVRAVGVRPDAPVLVALSGGADSVLLLAFAAAAEPRPRLVAVHVDHALRGAESSADAAFCARLCARLGVPLVTRSAPVPEGPSLEERARRLRYRALAAEATRRGIGTIVTGHHADDALETLLLRWMRGTHLSGLAGLRGRTTIPAHPHGPDRPAGSRRKLVVARPLIAMRREEVRHLLVSRGLDWREDSSNRSPRFTRNRVRHGLLPLVARACGPAGLAGLRAFGAAIERFEDQCAALTAELSWSSPAWAEACRGPANRSLGGTLDRAHLVRLPEALRRRALWRLLTEGCGGCSPTRTHLDLLLADLRTGRNRRQSLPGGWSLLLRTDHLHLEPPSGAAPEARTRHETAETPGAGRSGHQLSLPIAPGEGLCEPTDPAGSQRLGVPGRIVLPDGRVLTASIVDSAPSRPVPRERGVVELDARGLGPESFPAAPIDLVVRTPRPGDRFRGLGAPGAKPVLRFLADAGVPRGDRPGVPLVWAGDELLWVAGVRPAHGRRVLPGTRRRLRLELHQPGSPPPEDLEREPSSAKTDLFDGGAEAGSTERSGRPSTGP